MYNILEGRSEADRVVYEDEDPLTGFVLIPDLKWDVKDLSNLYLVAIARRRDILSLRDLTADHIPLLQHIMASGKVTLSPPYPPISLPLSPSPASSLSIVCLCVCLTLSHC